jgi:hypothetical protein
VLDVAYGPVADRLAEPSGSGPVHQASPGRALVEIESIARVLVEYGKRATVCASPDASAEDVEWLLSGPVRQAAWLQHGTMALRASGLVAGDGAVALLGVATAGKSAVAATLADRGHRVLADSVLPVDRDARAFASTGEIELWPAAVDELGLDPAAGRVVRPALSKRAFAFPQAEGAPLRVAVILDRGSHQGEPAAERILGATASRTLSHYTAMAPLIAPLGLRAEHFRWVTGLAANVRVFRLRCDRRRPGLAQVADAVEGLLG